MTSRALLDTLVFTLEPLISLNVFSIDLPIARELPKRVLQSTASSARGIDLGIDLNVMLQTVANTSAVITFPRVRDMLPVMRSGIYLPDHSRIVKKTYRGVRGMRLERNVGAHGSGEEDDDLS